MTTRDSINWLIDRLLPPDDNIPTAHQIWLEGRARLDAGDVAGSKRCEQLNYVLHNSYILSSTRIGTNVDFAYGGIGLVVHPAAEIGTGAVIGANVTLGGKTGEKQRTTASGRRSALPVVDDFAYISTGSKILGPVTIGKLAIVGANSVVTRDVPPLCIVAGSPARQKGEITLENCLSYKRTYTRLRTYTDEEFLKMVETLVQENRLAPSLPD